MASKCVKESYPFLVVLANSLQNKKLCREIVKNKKLLNAITELTVNTLQQNFPIKPKDKEKLKKFRKELLLLAKKGRSQKKRSVLKSQRGGQLLSTLLSIGLPVLAELLFRKRDGSHSEQN